MKVFVSGGAGYIGSVCVEQLLGQGQTVKFLTILIASSNRMKDELGWKPRYDSFDRFVESAWACLIKHRGSFGASRA